MGTDVAREEDEVDEFARLEFREGKCRVVNFELSGRASFSVSFNFTCPDAIVMILKKYNALWNKRRKEWTANISQYKNAALEVQNFCKPKGLYVDFIPQHVFDMFEFVIPFTDETK